MFCINTITTRCFERKFLIEYFNIIYATNRSKDISARRFELSGIQGNLSRCRGYLTRSLIHSAGSVKFKQSNISRTNDRIKIF